jgi:hypothetical protein
VSGPARFAKARAWFALCAFLCSLALPVLDVHAIGDADDAACQVSPRSDVRIAVRVSAASSSGVPAEHCVFCHLQRALSGASIADDPALYSPCLSPSCLPFTESHPLAATYAAPTSRGPPVSFAS